VRRHVSPSRAESPYSLVKHFGNRASRPFRKAAGHVTTDGCVFGSKPSRCLVEVPGTFLGIDAESAAFELGPLVFNAGSGTPMRESADWQRLTM